MTPPPRSVVLDYDGTLTDVEAGATAFRARFDARIAALLGRDEGEVSRAFREVEAKIDATPERFGWSFRGVVVAPACADPYIRATCAAHLVFDRFVYLPGEETQRADSIYGIYRESYQGTQTVFRADTKAVLEALLARLPVLHVVTNAAADVVSSRLATLDLAGGDRLRVVGDARKFVVEGSSLQPEAFARLPEGSTIPGLPRPVLVRRGHYFDVLVAIASELSVRAEEMLVCGDIFELDLAMPFAMGSQVHLLTRPTTPDYEQRFLQTSPRATLGETLTTVLDRIPT
ncbi:MAG: HAD family hydrolase [Polyangiales bacterium]